MEPAFNQAEDMLRRVSPEGRALAHRQRIERHRRATVQFGLCALLAIFLLVALYLLSLAGIETGAIGDAVAAAAFIVGSVMIVRRLGPKAPKVAELPFVPLASMPPKVGEWLEQERRSLPPPALPLVDSITRRLAGLGPQLSGLEQNGPASAAVSKLIAVELPVLVDRYSRIPPSAAPAATDELVHGLLIIDREISRMSDELASGSFDALATQHRFLQLKYDEGPGGS